MPNDNNDISNDELVMDEDVQPQKNGVDNIFQQFSSNYTQKKDRKPVIPFFLGLLGSLALFIGLCFVSAWFAFGLIASAGLFVFTINNNNYNNKQEAYEWEKQNHTNQLDTQTPTPDLVVENAMNNQQKQNYHKTNTPAHEETQIGKQNAKETKDDEKIFKQDFNANFQNNQDNKSNVKTKTNLDLINKIQKDGNSIEK